MLYKKKTNPKGFTLIEILITIAIIGFLASAILVSLSTTRQKARSARKKNELSQIMHAIQAYYSGEGSMPNNPTPGVLCNIGTNPACLQELVTRGYLASLPSSPDPARPYRYYYYTSPAPGFAVVQTLLIPAELGPGTVGSNCTATYYCLNFRR